MKNGIRINLGLIAHFIAAIIYILIVQYIVQDIKISMSGRGVISALFLITQFFTALICDYNEFYKKYINEKGY
jgi:hypothetical protein